MAKLTTDDLVNLTNETTAVTTLNANFALVETAIENTLSRDGTSPNTMESSLDMNSNRILNLLAASADTEPVRKAEFDAAVGSVDLAALAAARTAAEAAQTAAEAAYDSLDDRYLGAKASDPSLDNDGNALATGALYFNTAEGEMKVYNGSTWQVSYNPSSGVVNSVFGRTGAVVAATSDYAAVQVDFTPAGSIAATDVQAAIEELDTETTAALAGKAATSQVEMWSWFIPAPADQDYKLVVNIPYAVTVNSITTITTAGTITITGKINTTALGGTANSASSTESTQVHSTANAMVAGDDFVLTGSSNSSSANLTVTVKVTRTLA